MKQKALLEKHGKKIDYTFLAVLAMATILLALYFGVTNTYNSSNKNITYSLNSSDQLYVYDNFWHKFNTFTVIMINIKNNNHLVTLAEQEQFQNKFFKDFGLTNNDKMIERNENLVAPEVLFCYMKHYNPPNIDVIEIRKQCDK